MPTLPEVEEFIPEPRNGKLSKEREITPDKSIICHNYKFHSGETKKVSIICVKGYVIIAGGADYKDFIYRHRAFTTFKATREFFLRYAIDHDKDHFEFYRQYLIEHRDKDFQEIGNNLKPNSKELVKIYAKYRSYGLMLQHWSWEHWCTEKELAEQAKQGKLFGIGSNKEKGSVDLQDLIGSDNEEF